MEPIIETIKEFIGNKTRISKNDLNEETKLLDATVLSSLGFLELIVYIENTYNIEIGSDELIDQNYETIGNLASFVSAKNK